MGNVYKYGVLKKFDLFQNPILAITPALSIRSAPAPNAWLF